MGHTPDKYFNTGNYLLPAEDNFEIVSADNTLGHILYIIQTEKVIPGPPGVSEPWTAQAVCAVPRNMPAEAVRWGHQED